MHPTGKKPQQKDSPWPADSTCKTGDIPNKVCIVVVHNLILNCIYFESI